MDIPSSGPIYDSGFITPDGTPYSLDDTRHGDWALMYYHWLESKGYNISTPAGFDPDAEWSYDDKPVLDGRQSDAIRDELVRQGWIHVFTPEIISVWKYDSSTEEKIKKAYREGDINTDSDKVKIVEQNTDNSYNLNPKEVEESVFANMKFSIREAAVEVPKSYKDEQGWVSPDGVFYPLDGVPYHGQWVVGYYDWLTQVKHVDLPPKAQLAIEVKSKGSDYIRNMLVQQNWIHVYSPYIMSVNDFHSQEQKIIDYVMSNGFRYDNDDELEIFSLQQDKWFNIPYGRLVGVEEFASMKFSIREAKKKPLPNPWKKNYEYGEIPNWIDRVKHEMKKRKSRLEEIIITASFVTISRRDMPQMKKKPSAVQDTKNYWKQLKKSPSDKSTAVEDTQKYWDQVKENPS